MDFDSVFRKYHHRLYFFTLKFIENESDALDIVQNVFLSVWENEKLGVDELKIQPYLFNAVKNSCLNYIKHRRVVRKYEQIAATELKELASSMSPWDITNRFGTILPNPPSCAMGQWEGVRRSTRRSILKTGKGPWCCFPATNEPTNMFPKASRTRNSVQQKG
jgi:DNA-directed RNA polymerase specialized sigma24 family protein